MSVQQIDWNIALIQKYNYSGPRYTSYPTALEFSEDFGEQAFLQAVARYPERPLSLYVVSRSAISFVTSAVAIRLLLASSTRPIRSGRAGARNRPSCTAVRRASRQPIALGRRNADVSE